MIQSDVEANGTRSKSSSAEKISQPQNGEFVSLVVVKELMTAQESAIKSFFSTYVENTNRRIDKLTEEVKRITTSLKFTQAKLKELKKESEQLTEITSNQHKDLAFDIGSSSKRIDEMNEKIKELENKTEDLENQSRRNNLCFDGVKEDANELWSVSEKKIKELVSSNLNISLDEFSIERAHRVGKKDAAGKPRTIVAKFNNYKTRETILKNKKCLKGTNVFVREDFSQKVLAKRKELLPKMHEERKKGNIAFLSFDKLVV